MLSPDNALSASVAALDQYIGRKLLHDLPGRRFVEEGDVIDTLQRGQHLRTLFLWHNGPIPGLVLCTDRGVRVQPDDQHVSVFPALLQKADVAHMEQVV